MLTTGNASRGTFDNIRVRTNDPGFNEYNPVGAQVSIGDRTVTESNGTTTVQPHDLARQAATEAISVQWATGPGTALPGSDFVAASGTVTFARVSRRKTITIQIVGDTVYESDETFTVTLSNPAGRPRSATASGSSRSSTTTRRRPATVTVTATNGGEGGSPVVVTFTREPA